MFKDGNKAKPDKSKGKPGRAADWQDDGFEDTAPLQPEPTAFGGGYEQYPNELDYQDTEPIVEDTKNFKLPVQTPFSVRPAPFNQPVVAPPARKIGQAVAVLPAKISLKGRVALAVLTVGLVLIAVNVVILLSLTDKSKSLASPEQFTQGTQSKLIVTSTARLELTPLATTQAAVELTTTSAGVTLVTTKIAATEPKASSNPAGFKSAKPDQFKVNLLYPEDWTLNSGVEKLQVTSVDHLSAYRVEMVQNCFVTFLQQINDCWIEQIRKNYGGLEVRVGGNISNFAQNSWIGTYLEGPSLAVGCYLTVRQSKAYGIILQAISGPSYDDLYHRFFERMNNSIIFY